MKPLCRSRSCLKIFVSLVGGEIKVASSQIRPADSGRCVVLVQAPNREKWQVDSISMTSNILIVEAGANDRYGHSPVMFALLANALSDEGVPVTALTRNGWALEGQIEQRFELRTFGAIERAVWNSVSALKRMRPASFWQPMSVALRTVITVLAARRVRRALGRDDTDVILVSNALEPFVAATLAGRGRWLLCRFQPPRVVEPRGLDRLLARLARSNEQRRRALGGALRIAVSSGPLREEYDAAMHWLEPVQLMLIPCSETIARPSSRSNLGIAPDERVALLFGSGHRGKDHPTVFEAFEHLPEWRLVIAGGASASEYRRWRDQRGPAQDTTPPLLLDGFTSEETKAELYASADLVVLSFRADHSMDSGGLVEAVSWGRPVVCSDSVYAGKLVQQLELGTIFPSGNVEGLVAAVRSAPLTLNDATIEGARDEMSPRRMARQHLAALGRLTESN